MPTVHAEPQREACLRLGAARNARARLSRMVDPQDAQRSEVVVKQAAARWLLLRNAGVSQRTAKFYAAIVLSCICLSAIQLQSGFGLWAAIPLLPALLLILSVFKRSTKRALAFERDFSALILSLTSMVRSGKDPLVALRDQSEQWPEDGVLGQELRAVAAGLEAGKSPREVLERFARDVAYPDVALFRGAVSLSVEEGASLCPILERLAKVLRQRQSFRRKLRAALAMQRVSAFGIVGCALCVGLLQALTQGERLQVALQHPWGSSIIFSGMCLMGIGLVWMLLMSRQRV